MSDAKKTLEDIKKKLEAIRKISSDNHVSAPLYESNRKLLSKNEILSENYQSIQALKDAFAREHHKVSTKLGSITRQLKKLKPSINVESLKSKNTQLRKGLNSTASRRVRNGDFYASNYSKRKIELNDRQILRNLHKKNTKENKELKSLYNKVWLHFFLPAAFVGLVFGGAHFAIDKWVTNHMQEFPNVTEEVTETTINSTATSAGEVAVSSIPTATGDISGDISIGADVDSGISLITDTVISKSVVDTVQWAIVGIGASIAAALLISGVIYAMGRNGKRSEIKKNIYITSEYEFLRDKCCEAKTTKLEERVNSLEEILDEVIDLEQKVAEETKVQQAAAIEEQKAKAAAMAEQQAKSAAEKATAKKTSPTAPTIS